MSGTDNQNKGNSAEYLVCFKLQRRHIPVWMLGGNNKRWDIVFSTKKDEFLPGQVKARTQNAITFKNEDLIPSKGYYFIWYCPNESKDKGKDRLVNNLKKITKEVLGRETGSTLLIFNSKRIIKMCAKAKDRKSNIGKKSIFTNLTYDDINYGVKYYLKFMEKYSNNNKI